MDEVKGFDPDLAQQGCIIASAVANGVLKYEREDQPQVFAGIIGNLIANVVARENARSTKHTEAFLVGIIITAENLLAQHGIDVKANIVTMAKKLDPEAFAGDPDAVWQ